MKIDFAQIYEGWRNNLIPPARLKETIKQVSEERMEVCKDCEYHSENRKKYKTYRMDVHCTHCGCTLSAKTKCLSCACPLEKWTALITKEQEDEIDENEEES